VAATSTKTALHLLNGCEIITIRYETNNVLSFVLMHCSSKMEVTTVLDFLLLFYLCVIAIFFAFVVELVGLAPIFSLLFRRTGTYERTPLYTQLVTKYLNAKQ